MAKIPIILEPGRADGKLATSGAIFDENKGMFQSEINDIQDTLKSDNPNKPLSAKQGKILKDLLDSKVIEAGSVAIDTEPIEGNITHLVNSDGLAKEFNKHNTEIILGGVYDVSSHNNNVVFESLTALLSSSNLSTLIPTSVRHGGMSIRFVQSSDNRYVQYRLMSKKFSTTESDWQGVDNESIVGSDNLVKSGVVAKDIAQLDFEITKKDSLQRRYINGLILISSHTPHDAQTWNRYSYFIPLKMGQTLIAYVACDNNHYAISFYSEEDFSTFVDGVVGEPDGASAIRKFTYTAVSDGYAVVCCTEYIIKDYTFSGTDYYISDYPKYFVEPIVIQEDLSKSKTIELNAKKGDYIYIQARPHGECWLLFKNYSTQIAYLAFKNKVNANEKILLSDDINNIQITINGSQTVDFIIYYKGVLKDVLDLEEYKSDELYLYGKGSLYKKYNDGQIYKVTKRPNNTNNLARYSDFIPLAKNDVITMHGALDSNHYAIAFYTDRTFDSFVDGVLGNNITTKKDYSFEAPEDGYVILSSCEYSTGGNFSDSIFKIKKHKESNLYVDLFEDSNLPFGNFSQVTNIVDADSLSENDYRKTYPGLGYDIIYDEQNKRFVMLSAGYNETIGYAQIGISYSQDLENWVDYTDNPIFSPTGIDGDPDKGSVTFPQLLRFREKWLMFYIGFGKTGFERGIHTICYAESTDLINWTRKGVILTREDFVNAGVWSDTALVHGVIYRPKVINANGRYYMFINGGPNGDANIDGPNENVYVAISDNPTKGWKVLDIILDPAVLFPELNYKICSDPDVIFNGEDFILTWWGSNGIFVAKSNIHNFPINWKVNTSPIIRYMRRPLFVPTKEKLYLITNTNDAKKVILYKSDWNN